jgi:hypothetical protein
MFYFQPIFLGKTGTSTTSGGTTSSTGVAAVAAVAAAATRYTTSLALPEANDVLLVRLFFIRCFSSVVFHPLFFIQPRTYRLIAMYFFSNFSKNFHSLSALCRRSRRN